MQDGTFDLETETREECIIELEYVGEQEADEITEKVIDEQIVLLEGIDTETRVNDFIPDVLIKTDRGIPLAIEIAVTHFIDAEKRTK